MHYIPIHTDPVYEEDRFSAICREGTLTTLQKFVSSHEDFDFQKVATKSLSSVAKLGKLNFVKYLIEEHQADAHANEDSALCLATGNGRLSVAMYLVEECQARVNAVSEVALYCAADKGHLSTVKYLIEQGADYKYYQEKNKNAYNICHEISQGIEVKQNSKVVNDNVEKLRSHGSGRSVRRRPAPKI